MPDLTLNLNRSENAIYSRILCGCAYIMKYGLTSPELFLRRVHKRQAKKLRKKGVKMNARGYEYAVAENILHNLKILSSPLIPTALYTKLRQLLDIYGSEPRSAYVKGIFKDVKPANIFVLQALLKTMFLLGTFERPWQCHCGEKLEGNSLSNTMVALPITSYILREKCPSSGHWFVSWGQQASDVEVIKILIKHWKDVINCSFMPALKQAQLRTLRAWYCNLTHGTHPVTEPNEIPIMGIDDIINRPLQPSLSGDFEISLYSTSENTDNNKNCEVGLNKLASLDSLDQLYVDNMENLQSLKDRVVSIESSKKRTSLPGQAFRVNEIGEVNSLEDLEQSHAVGFLQWVIESKKSENIWSNTNHKNMNTTTDNEHEMAEEPLVKGCDKHVESLSQNILSGCGSGVYDLWGEYYPPVEKSVASLSDSSSFWSDYKDVSRRDLLISRIRNIIQQTIRKKLEEKQSEDRKDKAADNFVLPEVVVVSDPKLISPPCPKVSTSRILDLLVKANPITDIVKLEELASKISPNKLKNSEENHVETHSFEKAPHLIKEFVPKVEHKVDSVAFEMPAVSSQLDLKPIKLSLDPYLTSYIPSRGNSLVSEYRDNSNVARYHQGPYWEYPHPDYAMNPVLINGGHPSDSTATMANSTVFLDNNFNILPQPALSSNYSCNPSHHQKADYGPASYSTLGVVSECPLPHNDSGVVSQDIPPIPHELATTTPPNLPTVIMLSQLFSQ